MSLSGFTLANPRGNQGRPLGLNSFIFMQFSAKILQNNRLAQPLWSFREILEPSLLYVSFIKEKFPLLEENFSHVRQNKLFFRSISVKLDVEH